LMLVDDDLWWLMMVDWWSLIPAVLDVCLCVCRIGMCTRLYSLELLIASCHVDFDLLYICGMVYFGAWNPECACGKAYFPKSQKVFCPDIILWILRLPWFIIFMNYNWTKS
jgi:hypothetical protein